MVQYSGNAMHAWFVRYISKGRGSGLLNTIWRAEQQSRKAAGLLAKPLSWSRCCITACMDRACLASSRQWCVTVGVKQTPDGKFRYSAAMIHDQDCFSWNRKLWGWMLAHGVPRSGLFETAPHRPLTPCYTGVFRTDFRSCMFSYGIPRLFLLRWCRNTYCSYA